MTKRITALLLCLCMLLSLYTGGVFAADAPDYSANVGKYAVLADDTYLFVSDGTDFYDEVISFHSDEFEAGTIFRITDWYFYEGTSSVWYRVEFYSGGVVADAQEYWPATSWILQDYTDDDVDDSALSFISTCDICGLPDCDGIHAPTEDTTTIYVDGEELLGPLSMPKYTKPILSAVTTQSGEISYRWQILADAESGLWVNISGENRQELTLSYGKVASVLDSNHQAQVRCITTSGSTELISDPISVTLVPHVASAVTNESATVPTVAATEAATEPATEAATEPATEAATEPATEAATEPATEAATEPATEAATEPATEAATEPATEAVTEPTTEAPTEAATEPATEPATEAVTEAATEPATEAPTEPVMASAFRFSLSQSVTPTDDEDEGDTKTYQVTIHYMFRDGITPAAGTHSFTVSASGVIQNDIHYPAVEGYLPYVKDESDNFVRQDKFDARTITEDVELTVYYLPTEVKYQIVVYLQNVENDNYTKQSETIERSAETGTLVPDYTQEQPDGVKLEYEGFYPLLHEMPEVAADGSTVVEMYFDRYYYLITFNLNGGYGVEPIYARYGMPITVAEPTRPGYTFAGWDQEIPDTVPAENRAFTAQWEANDTTYSVAYWIVNDDGTTTYLGSRTAEGTADGTASGTHDLDNSLAICGGDEHTHSDACYICGETVHTHTFDCFGIDPDKDGNKPGDDGEAVIAAVNDGKPNPESGYIYVIKTDAGNLWPKLYLDGYYYTLNGIGAGTVSATQDQVNSIIEGDALGTGTYSNLTATKYRPKAPCGIVQHIHDDYSCRICEEHTHSSSCYQDDRHLAPVDSITVTKKNGEDVTYTTDTDVTIKGDGSTVVNVYYQYKEYTLKFYYAASEISGNSTIYKIIGGTSYYFGGQHTTGDNYNNFTNFSTTDLLNRVFGGGSDRVGRTDNGVAPSLNTEGQSRVTKGIYTQGSEYDSTSGRTYYYISFKARYGDDISEKWPIDVFNSVKMASGYTTTNGATGAWKTNRQATVSAWNGEHHVWYSKNVANETIKGKYQKLDYKILYDSSFEDSTTVSYLCFWENGAKNSWNVPRLFRYNIWVEALVSEIERDENGDVVYDENHNPVHVDGTTPVREKDGVIYKRIDVYNTCDNSDLTGQTQPSLIGYIENGKDETSLTGTTNVTNAETQFDSDIYASGINANFYYLAYRHSLKFWNHSNWLGEGKGAGNTQEGEGVMVGTPLVNFGNYVEAEFMNKPENYPKNLEKDAYTFAGWYTSPQLLPGTEMIWNGTMPDADVTVYAKWTPKIHQVTVYLTEIDETIIHDYEIPHGELVPEGERPPEPTNGNLEFIGWFYKDENGQEMAFDFNNMPVKDGMRLYAKWSSNVLKTYTIYYKLKDTDTEVASPTTGSALAGSTKTFEAKGGNDLYADYREGCFPLVQSHSKTLDINQEGDTVYTFWYIKKNAVTYTVHYYEVVGKDENGQEIYESLHPSKTVTTTQSEVVENYVRVQNYKPDAVQKKLVLSGGSDEKNEIIFWYTPNTTHGFLIVNHYLEDIPTASSTERTWTPSPDFSYFNEFEIKGNNTLSFSESSVNIEGFTYWPEAPGTVTAGNLSYVGEELELKLFYTRNKYPYQIQYLEYGTNKPLMDPLVFTDDQRAYFGDSVTTNEIPDLLSEGYTPHSVVGCTIKVEDNETNPSRNTIYVYYVPINGNLQIQKRVDNQSLVILDSDILFEFVVSVPEGVTGSYPVTIGGKTSDVAVANGIIKVSIKDGETATISGLPVGHPTAYQYQVSETPIPGFQATFAPSNEATLSNGATSTITCTNVYPVCDLTLTKTIKKEYVPDTWNRATDLFQFVITSPSLTDGKVYTVISSQGEKQYTVSNNKITLDAISVTDLDTPVSLTVKNIPIGNYTVTETMDNETKALYTTTADGAAGYSANVVLSTDNLKDQVDFVNTFKRTTGDLKISKEIIIKDEFESELDPDNNAEFTFTVVMPQDVAKDYFAGHTYTAKTGSGDTKTVTVAKDGTFTFKLKNGESLTIEDLPVGSYVVKEAPSEGYASSFPVPNPDGTVQATVEVKTGETTPLNCTNTYPVHVGNLKLTKEVINESGLDYVPNDEFTFQITFQDSGTQDTYPVTYKVPGKDDRSETLKAAKTGDNVVLTVTLKDGESILIERIPEGACRITEVDIPAKYTTANNGITDVTISPDQILPVTVENVFNPPTLTIAKHGGEAGQVFVYEVVNNVTHESMTVTVTGNGSTTIHNLLPGNYTITQKNSWSWRYGDNSPYMDILVDNDKTVTFSGTVQKDSWLDGNSPLVVNTKGGS